ncbi:MAG: decarboxylating NADP(+)-dependent phosphogluconate dehydrogenase [Bacteroidales bacterium]
MENKKSDIGLIGLAVMGENLALNIEGQGYQVSVYNRTKIGEESVVKHFMSHRGKDKNFVGFEDIASFVHSIEMPRKIMMMVRAGSAVDELIDRLIPFMAPGDVIIDGGNSNYMDTQRRVAHVEAKGMYFVGAGVSGGEEGALTGPSIMPGGSKEAWPLIKEIFQKIAAKAEDGSPCCQWIGGGGSGHFVKMVHNGIEYADMQLIAEAYFVMHERFDLSNDQIADFFQQWNKEKLQSYLIEITEDILRFKDDNGHYMVDQILDVAGQKGTGKWSVNNAMEMGLPLNLIATAVFERNISARKYIREAAADTYKPQRHPKIEVSEEAVKEVENALYASKLVSYAQGFELLSIASEQNNWHLNMASIARIWRGGCIIRSVFLNRIAEAYEKNMSLTNLLLAPYFKKEIEAAKYSWKEMITHAIDEELAVPAFSAALQYFYSLSTRKLPANLIQAQRDYFGAHTFERIDQPRGIFFHVNWTGKGGETQSGKYNA